MDWEGSGFSFLQKFPQTIMKKLKAGIFDSPQIRIIMKDPMFDKAQTRAKLSAWQLLKSLVTILQGNRWSALYEKEIEKNLKSFHKLRAQMSVKLHFLLSYLDYISKNYRDFREE